MIIRARFNGPPNSGNGGYTAGMMAEQLGGSAVLNGAEVTLRRPPPLETELTLRPEPDGTLGAFGAEDLVAQAHAMTVDAEPVPSVPLVTAVEASRAYRGFATHPFPTCFVCGPQRPDGLRIFPGRVPIDGLPGTAAPFHTPADISAVMMWAALDCPGGWAVPLEDRPYVLGRMAARVLALPEPGDECVVVGVMDTEQGRKAHVRTSLYSPAGLLLATARATWIALT